MFDKIKDTVAILRSDPPTDAAPTGAVCTGPFSSAHDCPIHRPLPPPAESGATSDAWPEKLAHLAPPLICRCGEDDCPSSSTPAATASDEQGAMQTDNAALRAQLADALLREEKVEHALYQAQSEIGRLKEEVANQKAMRKDEHAQAITGALETMWGDAAAGVLLNMTDRAEKAECALADSQHLLATTLQSLHDASGRADTAERDLATAREALRKIQTSYAENIRVRVCDTSIPFYTAEALNRALSAGSGDAAGKERGG